jgi:hypothetical protein
MCAAAMRRSMGAEWRRTQDICCDFTSLLALQAEPSRRRSQKLRDTNEIVGSGGEHEKPLQQAGTAMACPAQATDGLDPAERFFDAFSLDGADAIAGMPGRARIDRRAAFGIVLRDVRGAAAFTTADDKVGGVLPDIIEHERIGLIVKPGDIEGRAALGRHLIEDPHLRRRVGENGKALHRTRLDLEVCAERLVANWTESVHAGER